MSYARCDFIDRDFHFAISPWVTPNGRDVAGTSQEDEIGTFVPTITIKDSTIVCREQTIYGIRTRYYSAILFNICLERGTITESLVAVLKRLSWRLYVPSGWPAPATAR